ncbi:hypothetical protein DL89DRAFT_163385 [Linderina pennispora]|uniref:Uncharacterized protein n=1 Tax=Linderina pennispora TaxID=61395 RepID=A0A1Y1W7R3_9FUNG|nr:uncharacterized protein DL89DRAFT_163385 [Linderina pennispora]ORX69590.1 hypothetical protein DL89DRAFT_163385 [Linderina pennispora]
MRHWACQRAISGQWRVKHAPGKQPPMYRMEATRTETMQYECASPSLVFRNIRLFFQIRNRDTIILSYYLHIVCRQYSERRKEESYAYSRNTASDSLSTYPFCTLPNIQTMSVGNNDIFRVAMSCFGTGVVDRQANSSMWRGFSFCINQNVKND